MFYYIPTTVLRIRYYLVIQFNGIPFTIKGNSIVYIPIYVYYIVIYIFIDKRNDQLFIYF